MSGSVVADWDNEYARLARVASQLRSGVSNGAAGQDARALQSGLTRLESSLNHLPLASSEIQRRKRLVQHLQQTSSAGSSGAGVEDLLSGGGAVGGGGGQQQSSAAA